MAAHQPATPVDFDKAFRDVIRVGFNWDRFLEGAWPIETVTLDSQESLSRCFMPWYIGAKGDEVAYDDPDAIPMNLSDVPKAVALLNGERRADIQQYVDKFRGQKDAIRFSAPTYALPDNCYFILDRNHRLSALALNPVPFEVTLCNVRGPLDPDGLLDLIHWVPPRKSIPV